MVQIQFTLLKKRLDVQNTCPLIPYVRQHLIFVLPPPAPIKVDVICVLPLNVKLTHYNDLTIGKNVVIAAEMMCHFLPKLRPLL